MTEWTDSSSPFEFLECYPLISSTCSDLKPRAAGCISLIKGWPPGPALTPDIPKGEVAAIAYKLQAIWDKVDTPDPVEEKSFASKVPDPDQAVNLPPGSPELATDLSTGSQKPTSDSPAGHLKPSISSCRKQQRLRGRAELETPPLRKRPAP